jgi:hypothetical protein
LKKISISSKMSDVVVLLGKIVAYMCILMEKLWILRIVEYNFFLILGERYEI